ncbi:MULTISPECIES: hypothetical protein [unclassified Sphingomonas]|uniref:hypothetical protein n=1 Tax=unclassified Sphingomonas TaxID=196159 RepID=UPI0007006AA1|nr:MULTISPECIES: hypothetical protein [unclassified Sphingomonas]KQX19364.1 hypothetical protein ASD17_12545 [Sphingomonas sp. Root1294]KQY65567.1 hypothetical protein ASD39_15745 [Sphingomonas sp. Root50]KRB95132.1 hypothetical protein ASE22_04310 [Sphingomonas sp. Root720]
MIRTLSRAERDHLVRIRRQPQEAGWRNPQLNRLRRDGLVDCTPLTRPSGAISKYREWSITDAGREALEKLP